MKFNRKQQWAIGITAILSFPLIVGFSISLIKFCRTPMWNYTQIDAADARDIVAGKLGERMRQGYIPSGEVAFASPQDVVQRNGNFYVREKSDVQQETSTMAFLAFFTSLIWFAGGVVCWLRRD